MPNNKVKVELLTHVVNLGKAWDVLEVSFAHAHNLLIPKKLACIYVPKKGEISRDEVVSQRHEIAAKLHAKECACEVLAHGNAIAIHFDEQSVADYIKQKFHISLPAKMIHFVDKKRPKHLGRCDVTIDIASDVYIKVLLDIVPSKK